MNGPFERSGHQACYVQAFKHGVRLHLGRHESFWLVGLLGTLTKCVPHCGAFGAQVFDSRKSQQFQSQRRGCWLRPAFKRMSGGATSKLWVACIDAHCAQVEVLDVGPGGILRSRMALCVAE